ncbi:hypothetical protein, conserved [Leishmania donovani]|uniref:Uncharacterized protein n=2 Tax=Leishmania donovani TaxID=5661 RepID=E9BN64_LEIDO|nr:hypothetical protein, conserved [Leishmania donovani]AYU81501.1 hypothetical protein LdCL_310037700 [Leishmania donovani]CBZ36692.1 hypothetical protein, conserved [Leishmania donovani]
MLPDPFSVSFRHFPHQREAGGCTCTNASPPPSSSRTPLITGRHTRPSHLAAVMSESLPGVLCFLGLIVFFVADFFYAKKLNEQKNAHPELDDCAPATSPDLDTIAVLDSLTATAVDFYRHERQRFTGVAAPASPNEYAAVGENGVSEEPAANHDFGDQTGKTVMHTIVVVCSIAAPLLTVLVALMPSLFGWTRFGVHSSIAYLAAVPGMAATGFYAMRSYELTQVFDVTKTEWIAMMWLRLDAIFLMSAVAFFGVGAWVVAGCMVTTAMYLAHRLMRMEKQLNRVQRHTQLVRDEVDVTRVLVPGTAESKRASGINDGYSALSS